MSKVSLGKVADMAPNRGRLVAANGKELAVFKIDGCVYAIDNACKHLGGPLSEGFVEGTVVTCPWHQWAYDMKTGEEVLNGDESVQCYPTKIEGDEAFVDVE